MATQESAPSFSRLLPNSDPDVNHASAALAQALREMVEAEEKFAYKLSRLGPDAYTCARDARELATMAKSGIPGGTTGAARP